MREQSGHSSGRSERSTQQDGRPRRDSSAPRGRPSNTQSTSYSTSSTRSNSYKTIKEITFQASLGTLSSNLQAGKVISSESWAKLIAKICTADHARQALQLMLADAAAKDAMAWDWTVEGYGQTVFKLVQAAGEVGAYDVPEQIMRQATPRLHMTINKDFVPNMVRKLGAAKGKLVPPEVLLQLLLLEKEERGTNSHASIYQVCRVFIRRKQAAQVQQLYAAAVADGVELKEEFVEEVQQWLQQHGGVSG